MEGVEGYPIFVGDLPQDITEEELRTVFKTYGEVQRIKVLTGADKRGSGNAVVFYATKKAAEDAITVLHKAYKIREGAPKPICVSWAVRGKAKAKAPSRPESQQEDKDRRGLQARERQPDRRSQRSRSRGDSREQRRGSNGGARSGGAGREADGYSGRHRRCQAESDDDDDDDDRERAGSGKGWRAGGGISLASKGRYSKDSDDGDWGSRGKGRWGKSDKGRSKGRRGDDGGACSRLYVERLPSDITEGALKDAFATYGNVLGVKIISVRGGGPARAIVRYDSVAAAETAVATVHNKYEMRPGDGPILARFARPNARWD